MRTRCRFAPAFSFMILAIPSAVAQAPDPVALLRGAEAARQAIRSGEMEFTVDESWEGRKPLTTVVKVAFDGAKRTVRVEQDVFALAGGTRAEMEANAKRYDALNLDTDRAVAAGIGRREHRRISQAFDGARFCNYQAGPNIKAYYRNMEDDGQMMFVPQTLGLVDLYNAVDDLSLFFSNKKAKDITLVGKEAIGNVATWHVRYDVDTHYHLWIEDSEPFRVHKVECECVGKFAGYRSTVSSVFRADGSPLPVRVDVKQVSPKRTDLESTLIVHSAKFNEPVDPSVGTLASLQMPAGADVFDTFAEKKLLGRWDGEKIADKLPSPRRAAAASRWPDGQQIFMGSGALTLLVGAVAYLWWRHQRHMREASTARTVVAWRAKPAIPPRR
jgi:hypothetical protein